MGGVYESSFSIQGRNIVLSEKVPLPDGTRAFFDQLKKTKGVLQLSDSIFVTALSRKEITNLLAEYSNFFEPGEAVLVLESLGQDAMIKSYGKPRIGDPEKYKDLQNN